MPELTEAIVRYFTDVDGIDFPAAVVSELELNGYQIERVYDGGRPIAGERFTHLSRKARSTRGSRTDPSASSTSRWRRQTSNERRSAVTRGNRHH